MTTETFRCFGTGDPLYEQYHDEEWGRPIEDGPDERHLLERIGLEGFQSGLSWITVLRKREAFREAFHGFEPAKVAAMTNEDVERLREDPAIIRNRAKIEATIGNAQALLRLHEDGVRLTDLYAQHAPPERDEPPLDWKEVPGTTDGSFALSKLLRRHGFRFVGPTTIYATMQAIGLVNDHLAQCPVRDAVDRERRASVAT